jgi:hypothetical protein
VHRCLGSIWIIDPGEDKREASLNALDRMAPLAGLHMLHARSASDFGERRNGDLIRTLMDDTAHASFAAAQLGLDAAHGLAVAAFSIVRPETGSLESVREIQRLLHLVTTVCNLQFNTSHSALIDSVGHALLPCEGTAPRALHRRVVQEIGAYAHTISSYPLIAAVGGIAPRVEDLPGSRSEYLDTLRAYLASNGNISTMAERLHVHNNTVRYRVARLTKDFDLDLDDPQKRLWLWLRLTTMDLTSQATPTAPRSGPARALA